MSQRHISRITVSLAEPLRQSLDKVAIVFQRSRSSMVATILEGAVPPLEAMCTATSKRVLLDAVQQNLTVALGRTEDTRRMIQGGEVPGKGAGLGCVGQRPTHRPSPRTCNTGVGSPKVTTRRTKRA